MSKSNSVAFIVSSILLIASNVHGAFAKEKVDLKKVAMGNAAEIDRAFNERGHSDGEAGEDLDIAIGRSIRKNPEAFLKAYTTHQPTLRLDSLVGNLGPEFADEFKKQEDEVRGRIAALKKVKEPSLQSAAEACITELQRFLKQIHSVLKANPRLIH